MWLNRGNLAPFVHVWWSIHAFKMSLIINFMSILMQFLTFLKTNSRAEAMFASIQT